MKRTKDEVQKEAEKVLSLHNDTGIVAMATGTGKSKIAVDKIAEHQQINFDLRALIVVPTEKLRDENWKEEFYKWDQSFLWNNNVERSCYASISKIKGEVFDLVILDEGHNITEHNSVFFEQNTVHHIILLTATVPEEKEKLNILSKLGLKVVYKVTLDEAVEWGLVSPYKITVVYTTLDNVKKVIPAGSKTKRFYQTEQQAYWYITKEIEKIPVGVTDAALLAKRNMLVFKRLRFIYDLPSKTEAAQFMLKHYVPQDKRVLIFAGSIAQAEKVCEHFFHSKTKDTDYNLFKEKELNRLSCVLALNEGDNIVDLDGAVIIQLNSVKRDMIQRMGRTVRHRENHLARIIILCVRNTVDQDWLHSALSGVNRDCIEYESFANIKMRYL